jgi:sRNA-binding carbon storage regulator CsrA
VLILARRPREKILVGDLFAVELIGIQRDPGRGTYAGVRFHLPPSAVMEVPMDLDDMVRVGGVEVKLWHIGDREVKFGVIAPADVRVDREEVRRERDRDAAAALAE